MSAYKFQPGQRVRFKSQTSDHWFKGEIIRSLKDGYYLVDDGRGFLPRPVHGNRLGLVELPKAHGTFA